MNESGSQGETSAVQSALNNGLGCSSPTYKLVCMGEEAWLIIDGQGVLIKFDNSAARRSAAIFDDSCDNHAAAIAKAIILVLDAAAAKVDHILREGGGTYGNAIREINLTPNGQVNWPHKAANGGQE